MKLLITLSLMLSFAAMADVSSTLQASIIAAREVSPALFEEAKIEITRLAKACKKAPEKVSSLKEQLNAQMSLMMEKERRRNELIVKNMSSNLGKSLDNLMVKLNVQVDTGTSCLRDIFQLDVNTLIKREAMLYLLEVRQDIKQENYKACHAKLYSILKVGI